MANSIDCDMNEKLIHLANHGFCILVGGSGITNLKSIIRKEYQIKILNDVDITVQIQRNISTGDDVQVLDYVSTTYPEHMDLNDLMTNTEFHLSNSDKREIIERLSIVRSTNWKLCSDTHEVCDVTINIQLIFINGEIPRTYSLAQGDIINTDYLVYIVCGYVIETYTHNTLDPNILALIPPLTDWSNMGCQAQYQIPSGPVIIYFMKAIGG